MPLPEGYLPRKGDELLIRVKVDYDVEPGDEDMHVCVVGYGYKKLVIVLGDIHALHCRKWNEGDKVSCGEFEGPGTVIATNSDDVWVRDDGLHYAWTVPANELKPWVEPDVVETVTEQKPDWMRVAPYGGAIGSQSLVGDDDPIAARDEAAN